MDVLDKSGTITVQFRTLDRLPPSGQR